MLGGGGSQFPFHYNPQVSHFMVKMAENSIGLIYSHFSSFNTIFNNEKGLLTSNVLI